MKSAKTIIFEEMRFLSRRCKNSKEVERAREGTASDRLCEDGQNHFFLSLVAAIAILKYTYSSQNMGKLGRIQTIMVVTVVGREIRHATILNKPMTSLS